MTNDYHDCRKMVPIREKVQAGKFSLLQMRMFVWWPKGNQ